MNLAITKNTYFVPKNKELVESVFKPGGTASGTYKKEAGGILFFRPNGEPFAFLVANRHGERFFVSCGKTEDGKIRYMHGLSKQDQSALGLGEVGYGGELDAAKQAWECVNGRSAGRLLAPGNPPENSLLASDPEAEAAEGVLSP